MKSNIGYKGELTVYTMYKDRVIDKYVTHNEGKAPLFNFLVNCLAGDWVAADAPRYLGVYHKGVDEQSIHYQLNPVTSIVKHPSEDGNSASVEYTFTIPGSNIMPNISGDLVKLFSSSNMGGLNPSAVFEFAEGKELQGTTVAAGLSYLVVWKMTIANQPILDDEED